MDAFILMREMPPSDPTDSDSPPDTVAVFFDFDEAKQALARSTAWLVEWQENAHDMPAEPNPDDLRMDLHRSPEEIRDIRYYLDHAPVRPHKRIVLDPDADDFFVFVNVYAVTRHYGGPEEGGWWFNAGEPVESHYVQAGQEGDDFIAAAEARAAEESSGDIYSVRGGVEHSVMVEAHPARCWPARTPHYE